MNHRPLRRADLVIDLKHDEAHLTDPTTGEVHVLNASAYAIWELCDGKTPIGSIADALSEVTPMGPTEALAQVEHAVELLAQKRLVS